MEFLTTRYSQTGNSALPGLELPNTIQEFNEKYTLSFSQAKLRQRRPITEVKHITDIRSGVVYNVLHSNLCTAEDKASWAFQLQRVYQQFNDSLARSTLTKMKSDMMVSQKKKSLNR